MPTVALVKKKMFLNLQSEPVLSESRQNTRASKANVITRSFMIYQSACGRMPAILFVTKTLKNAFAFTLPPLKEQNENHGRAPFDVSASPAR